MKKALPYHRPFVLRACYKKRHEPVPVVVVFRFFLSEGVSFLVSSFVSLLACPPYHLRTIVSLGVSFYSSRRASRSIRLVFLPFYPYPASPPSPFPLFLLRG